MAAILNFRNFPKIAKHKNAYISKTVLDRAFYCEKYTYHFLTIAICWCHPTHWPTLRNVLRNLKRPVSECELGVVVIFPIFVGKKFFVSPKMAAILNFRNFRKNCKTQKCLYLKNRAR